MDAEDLVCTPFILIVVSAGVRDNKVHKEVPPAVQAKFNSY
jgi:hypothetical protein